mgnify:CR=1 FL=1
MWNSSGSVGFKGSRRSTSYAAQMAAEDLGKGAAGSMIFAHWCRWGAPVCTQTLLKEGDVGVFERCVAVQRGVVRCGVMWYQHAGISIWHLVALFENALL